MQLPDSYKRPKPSLDERDFWIDPDRDSSPGLLLSDRIQFYASRVHLIYPFDKDFLEPASYTLHAGREYLMVLMPGKVVTGNLEKEGKVTIPPNGLIIIRFFEEVNIPHYMIARFNLRVKQVYRGLLLGTGPQVDPGFKGYLGCPIHNFTDGDKAIQFFEPLVTIDFEKTTSFGESFFSPKNSPEPDSLNFDAMRLGLTQVTGINNLPCKIYNKKQDRSLQDYLTGGESIRSSIFDLQERVKRCEELVKRSETISIGTALGAVIGIVGAIIGILSFVSSFYTNLETNFSASYNDLNESVGELRQSVGRLEGAKATGNTKGISIPSRRSQTESPPPSNPLTPKGKARTETEKRDH